jgi:uncharacterized protein
MYLDTSSLTKAYVSERGSDHVQQLLEQTVGPICISTLSLVEFRCALARRTRALMLTESESQRIWASFEGDVDDGIFDILPVENDDLINARRLIDAVAPLPLKALDALHLAVVRRTHERDATSFVTSDAQQATAAAALGINTKTIALTL